MSDTRRSGPRQARSSKTVPTTPSTLRIPTGDDSATAAIAAVLTSRPRYSRKAQWIERDRDAAVRRWLVAS